MIKNYLTIYCDMDGVLADFFIEKNAVERFKSEKGFFYNLKPISENVNALKELYEKGYRIKVLTTSPHNRADREKRLWLKKHLSFIDKKDIIFGRPNKRKIDYLTLCKRTKAILIDDYGKNIQEWLYGGGLDAIKITPNPKVVEQDFLSIKNFSDYLEAL